MRLRFEEHPIDLYACLLLSGMVAALIHLGVTGPWRMTLGLPFILLVPGYTLIFALFPEKEARHRGIGPVERIALSLGMSIAIVPLIGLGLNYTPWGIRLEPILVSLLLFVSGAAIAGAYRWRSIEAEKRHVIEIQIASSSLGQTGLDNALTLALAISILAALGALIWALTTPRIGERFTEFYILGPGGKADDYPTTLGINQSATVIVGIQNHEYQNLTYHLEVWLVNQTWDQDTNTTDYHWGILLDLLNVTLPSRPMDIDQAWTPQWEANYTFRIPVPGTNKLAFLLFKEEPPSLPGKPDHSALPGVPGEKQGPEATRERVETAYRQIYLWIEAR